MAIGAFEIGRLPRIQFGVGAAAGIAGSVSGLGRRAFVVTGRRSFRETPRWPTLLESLRTADVAVGVAVAGGEPSPESVDAIVERAREHDADVVLGIGGGSVLDTAKAVAGLVASGTSAFDHLEGVGPRLPYAGPALPWIAVPTTAGTGSEATRNAPLSRPGPDGFKRSFRDERLVAAVAIVDPDLLTATPPDRIAANGSDALTQLLESYVSVRASPFTDALAVEGLAKAARALPAWHRAASSGADEPGARGSMAWAALLSGITLAHAGLGVVHGIVAALGGLTSTPHGAGCAALLAAGVEANVRALEARAPSSPSLAKLATLGRLVAGSAATDDAAARRDLVAWLRALTAELQLPGLATYGVGSDNLPAIVAQSRGSSMRTNPVDLTDDEIATVNEASL